MDKQKIKFGISGAAAGIINGFFGGGGGMALVPLYTQWLGLEYRQALATSVCTILPLCVVSSIVYFLRRALDLKSAIPYLVGGLIGGIISGVIFKRVPIGVLRKAFALLIIYGGIKALI